MDYHKDRFEDCSLMIFNKNTLVSLLAANIKNQTLYSHQGLSYGGFVFSNKVKFETVLKTLKAVLKFMSNNDLYKLILKQTPKIYYTKPSDEIDYLLFILKAKLYRRDVSMTINLKGNIEYSSLRKREIKKAQNLKLTFTQDDDLSLFWNHILIPNLSESFNVKPVHNLEEIKRLKNFFPNKIKQYNVFDNEELLAGCTVFETKNVVHLQYISTQKSIKKGALTFLIHQLISKVYKHKKHFDFGISNENNGKNINLGLLNWKQSFGASSMVHDFYEIDANNRSTLDDVIL